MEGIVMRGVCHGYMQNAARMHTVLHGIDLNIKKGECVALTGESGSGKSTVARLLLGVERPLSGCICIDGEDICAFDKAKWRKFRRKIQGVFQDASGTLNSSRSVYQNMEEGLRNLTCMNAQERKETVMALMELFHLDASVLRTAPAQLSGGEQRRASLVRALAIRPKYLVLDEVASGLDAISVKAVMDTLQSYQASFGCTYLFITHDLASAYRISDRVIKMQEGHLVMQGVPSEKNHTGKEE